MLSPTFQIADKITFLSLLHQTTVFSRPMTPVSLLSPPMTPTSFEWEQESDQVRLIVIAYHRVELHNG